MIRNAASLFVLLTLACCGGGGASAPAPMPLPAPLVLHAGDTALTLDSHGRLAELRAAGDVRNLAASDPKPLVEMDVGGQPLSIESVELRESGLVVRFGLDRFVRLAVADVSGALVFRVAEVQPTTAQAVRVCVALIRLSKVDPTLNGTYDDNTILCVRSLDARSRCAYRALAGGVPQPCVEWTSQHGIVGGAAAVVASTRAAFFTTVNALEVAEDLPSPRFDGVAARASATARESYLFLTYYAPGDAAKIIEYANLAGLRNVLMLRGLWRTSSGTYAIDTTRWPGGLPEFTAFCDQLHAAGLGVGLHFYGPSISANDPLITPFPADGLLATPCPALLNPVSNTDDTLVLGAVPSIPAAGAGGYPGTFLRLGNEIIRYAAATSSPPFSFTGCERGALGTTATAHPAGTTPHHLVTLNDLFLIDPDGPLVATLAANLAQVVNAAQIDMVYYDGTARVPPDAPEVQRWYYMNRILPAMYAAFDHDVIVQTGMGPGRQLDWHIVPRSASADGHGNIKWYLDQRTPAIDSIRRGLSIPDIGWYGFDAGRPPDHLEYICAKALGWDCGISLQTFVIELEKDRRAREIIEMVGRYERWKQAGGVPASIRELLQTPAQDFRLLEDDSGAPELYRCTYDPALDIRTLPSGARTWAVGNSEGAPRTLGIEITRGDAIRTHADFAAGGVATIDPLTNAAPYQQGSTNDSARLMNRVSKVTSTAGAARAGVSHSAAVVPDAAVGGQALELTATNSNRTIGWCAIGRSFAPALDLSAQAATGLWIHGDGSGAELALELYDDIDQRVVVKVPLFFEGWRFHTFEFKTTSIDATKITYFVIVVEDLPPESSIAVRFALMRATPTVIAAADLTGMSIEVGGRTIALPDLGPGGTHRIDARGTRTTWPGGMQPGQSSPIPGGPLAIPVGVTSITLRATGPTPFPGDVVVRTSRMLRVHPE